jgi:hypothetical protein
MEACRRVIMVGDRGIIVQACLNEEFKPASKKTQTAGSALNPMAK